MTCPHCGQDNQQPTRFCRKCGANLEQGPGQSARVATSDTQQPAKPGSREDLARVLVERIQNEVRQPKPFNLWESVFGEDRSEEIEGLVSALNKFLESPEEKRLRRIRAGVVTASIGIGFCFFAGIFFDAVANTITAPAASSIVRAIFALGLIPFSIGLGLTINGLFFTRTRVASAEYETMRQGLDDVRRLGAQVGTGYASVEGPGSVTEQSTTRLDPP